MGKVSHSSFANSFFKLYIPLLFIFFAIGLAHTLSSLRDFHRHQRQMAQECVRVVHKVISNDAELIIADLLHLATLNELRTYLHDPSEESLGILQREYYNFSDKKKIYDQLRFLDMTGMEVVRVDFEKNQSVIVEQDKLQHKGNRYYFREALQMQQDDFYVSPLDLNVEQGEVERPFVPVLRLGVPVFDENGLKRGVVILNYFGNHLIEDIQEISSGFPGTLFLVNHTGHWLSGPDPEKNWTFMFPGKENISFANEYPQKWQKIAGENKGQLQQKYNVTTFSTYYLGNGPGPGEYFWKIVNELPLGLFGPGGIGFTWRFFLGFLFIALVLATGCIFYLKARFQKADSDEVVLKLSRAVEQSRSSIAITDKNGNIEYVNTKFSEVTGYGQDEATGQNLKVFATGLPSDFYKEMWADLETGKEWHGEFLNKKKDGRLFWEYGSIAPIKNEHGTITHYVAIKEDISERKQFEQELHRLASFPEENPNIVLEINLQGEITYVNPACQKRFPSEKAGFSHSFLKNLQSKLADFEKKKGNYLDDELEVEESIFQRRVAFISEHNLIRVYGFEITHLKKIEKALKEAKKQAEEGTRLKSIFLANMSHEIRTPLNAILGYTDLMLMDAQSSMDKERLSIISESGKKLLTLISDILDFSKIEAGKLDFVREEFSICQVADYLTQMFSPQAKGKKIDFQVVCESNVPERVVGDAKRLVQILVNLLNNAFKFTEKGSVSLHCSHNGKVAQFTVSDTGIGIRKEMQKIIFSEFQQADASTDRMYGGTGLGLSITRRLIKLMGGTIDLKSDLGEGTALTVHLPFAAVQEKKAKPSDQKGVRVSGEMFRSALAGTDAELRILLAEDNEMNQRLIREMLKKVDLDVVVAENGRVALDKMAQTDFHLLLLDMQMPVLDGLETIKKIRAEEKWKDLYVIALTGEALPGDAEKFLSAGCNDYVAKPVGLEILYGKMYAFFVDKFSLAPDDVSLEHQEIQAESAEGFGPFEMSPDLKIHLIMTVDVLKKNQKIFNPDQIHNLASSLDEYDSIEQILTLKGTLQRIAATFDDEALPGLIKKLEETVQFQ